MKTKKKLNLEYCIELRNNMIDELRNEKRPYDIIVISVRRMDKNMDSSGREVIGVLWEEPICFCHPNDFERRWERLHKMYRMLPNYELSTMQYPINKVSNKLRQYIVDPRIEIEINLPTI